MVPVPAFSLEGLPINHRTLSIQFLSLALILGLCESQSLVAQAPKMRFTLKGSGRWVAFTPDGKSLVSVVSKPDVKPLAIGVSEIRIWEVATGKNTSAFTFKEQSFMSMALSPDGKTLATAGRGKTMGSAFYQLKLWDLAIGQEIATLEEFAVDVSAKSVKSVAFSPDGKTLATLRRDKSFDIFLWDVATGKNVEEVTVAGRGSGILNCIAFSPDGRLAYGSSPRTRGLQGVALKDLALTKVKTKEPQLPLSFIPDINGNPGNPGNYPNIKQFAISPNGRFLAVSLTNSAPGFCRLVDAAAKSPKAVRLDGFRPMPDLPWPMPYLSFSSDNGFLAGGRNDGFIAILNLATNKTTTFEAHAKAKITAVVFSPDCKNLASAASDGTIKLWEIDHGIIDKK